MMATENSKSKRSGTGKQAAARVNLTRCPEGLSLEEWQRGLRKYAAEHEPLEIEAPEQPGEPFFVTSGKSGATYRVDYYGQSSALNRCECMDFKTNRLGTCKHIEAVSLAGNGKYARQAWPLPGHTYVYVDYTDGRKLKIRRGTDVSAQMEAHIREYFDESDIIRNPVCNPLDFIVKARELDEAFEWESDALNLIIEARDRELRRKIVADKYATSGFDGLLRTRLMPYQADGVRFAFVEGRTINADEMGLGKTVQAIAAAELLKKEGLVETVLVICPTSLKYQWLSEIKRFTESSAIVVEGNLLRRRDQLRDGGVFYKICSFQSVANNIKAGYIPEADMVIYDELQRLKNRDTKMGIQLRKLRSQYVMALSGTPLENRIDELYSVTQLVDQFILGPLYQFTAETTLKDDTGRVIGYRNLHQVADKLRQTLIRRRKVDVKLQMPARTDTNLYVPLTKEQRGIHDEYKGQVAKLIFKWRRQKFLSENDRKRLLLFLSIMRMVCDSTFILDQKTRYDTKVDELMAIISNMLSSDDGKVVIFSQWERMLRIVARQLDGDGIDYCFLHGCVPSPKRKNLIDRFRDDPDCRIFLSTDAGATGLNLQSASLLVNIDLPWNPAVLEQRISRIYRLGQKNPVQIINMIARDTIEQRMLATLDLKSNLAAGILDGGNDAVFLDSRKFDRIIEVIDDVIDLHQESSEAASPAPLTPEEESPEAIEEPVETASKADRATGCDGRQEPVPQAATQSARTERDEMHDLIAGGMSILGKLAEAIRKPQSAQILADALVKEDPATGQASLNIPVPDKAAVVNLFTAISALLNK